LDGKNSMRKFEPHWLLARWEHLCHTSFKSTAHRRTGSSKAASGAGPGLSILSVELTDPSPEV
jgi:hypothetical protein